MKICCVSLICIAIAISTWRFFFIILFDFISVTLAYYTICVFFWVVDEQIYMMTK